VAVESARSARLWVGCLGLAERDPSSARCSSAVSLDRERSESDLKSLLLEAQEGERQSLEVAPKVERQSLEVAPKAERQSLEVAPKVEP
jgi:hypothetical protein